MVLQEVVLVGHKDGEREAPIEFAKILPGLGRVWPDEVDDLTPAADE